MSVYRHLSTPGAEELLAWRKLSASEKPWRQMRAMVAVSGGISTEEILIKFSVDTDTKVFEMLTYKYTLRIVSIDQHQPKENPSPEGRCEPRQRRGTP